MPMNTTPLRFCAGAVLLVAALGGCGGSHSSAAAGSTPASAAGNAATATGTESNPGGDIPDSQVYVAYTPPGGSFTIKVPEGWAKSAQGAVTTFSDKLNTVRLEEQAATTAPTTASVTATDVPALKSATQGFALGKVSAVQRKAGPAVLITYQGRTPPDPVTGKSFTDAFERYAFWRSGHELIVTLSGPVSADNVDPWRTITDSLAWRI